MGDYIICFSYTFSYTISIFLSNISQIKIKYVCILCFISTRKIEHTINYDEHFACGRRVLLYKHALILSIIKIT